MKLFLLGLCVFFYGGVIYFLLTTLLMLFGTESVKGFLSNGNDFAGPGSFLLALFLFFIATFINMIRKAVDKKDK